MWKKGFSTVACMGTPYNEIIEKCLKYGIEGVEIRLDDDGSVCGINDYEELGKLQKDFLNSGLCITNLGSSVCFKEYCEEQLLKGKDAVDKASFLNVKAVRVFLGYFAAMINPQKPEPDYKGIISALKELCDYAKDKNVEIWVETHNEFATGKVLKKLIADVGRDNLKIIWDIIHPIEDGESIDETWEFVGQHISHIHFKDGFDRHDPKWHDFKYTKLGEGELPLCNLITLLNRENYTEYVSLEWEREWREEIQVFPADLDFIFHMFNTFIEGCDR